jgi:magnesium transporter
LCYERNHTDYFEGVSGTTRRRPGGSLAALGAGNSPRAPSPIAAKAAAAFAELDADRVADLLGAFESAQLAEIVEAVAPADAADLLLSLPPGVRRETLANLSASSAESVRALLRYPEDTAGGIMSNRFIALGEAMSVEEVRELLRARAREERTESIAYL